MKGQPKHDIVQLLPALLGGGYHDRVGGGTVPASSKSSGPEGMGEVYLGHDSRLQRKVALKSLTAPTGADADRREQILLEARAAARLNHPGIAAVYDVVEQGDRAYIVMEYVEGETLAARLAQGPLPMDRVFAIGRELAAALAAAHAGGVVHHDLKPANIQLTPSGAAKVLDFGVARVTTPTAMPTETTRSVIPVLSPGDGRSGTLVYMAPEQLLNKPVDARSDIYSLGVVLFEMATGQRPFQRHGPRRPRRCHVARAGANSRLAHRACPEH